MTPHVRRRLVEVETITVRRTVGAPSSTASRSSWRCRVFAQRRATDVARGAEIWSTAERSALADLMRRAV